MEKETEKKAIKAPIPCPSFFTNYLPTILTGVFFGITYIRYTPAYLEEEDRDYRYYLAWTPAILIDALFVGTLIGNLLFGRRPNNSDHYNPVSDRVIQAVGGAMPAVLAGATGLGRMAATAIAGDRAEGTNHMAVVAGIVADHAARAVTIDNLLYSNAMDRSPALDGSMRFLERVAWRAERGITYVVELAVEGVYLAMESGVVNFALNDNNRLTVIAGLYYSGDIARSFLVGAVNEYAYYAERTADIPIISGILLRVGIANLEPVIAFIPRITVAQGAEVAVTGLVNGAAAAVDVIENLGEDVAQLAVAAGHKMGRVVEFFHTRKHNPKPNEANDERSTEVVHHSGCFGFMPYRSVSASSAQPEASSAAVDHAPRSQFLYLMTHGHYYRPPEENASSASNVNASVSRAPAVNAHQEVQDSLSVNVGSLAITKTFENPEM